MSDDLEKFHALHMGADPQYAVARHLLQLGEAVTQLRHNAKLTRSQLGKLLRVKAQDIAVVEEETPRASAGLLEAALIVLLHKLPVPGKAHQSEVAHSLRTVRQLRPALLTA